MKRTFLIIITVYLFIFLLAIVGATISSQYNYGYQQGFADGRDNGYKTGWDTMANRASKTNHLLYDNFCKYIADHDPYIVPEGC